MKNENIGNSGRMPTTGSEKPAPIINRPAQKRYFFNDLPLSVAERNLNEHIQFLERTYRLFLIQRHRGNNQNDFDLALRKSEAELVEIFNHAMLGIKTKWNEICSTVVGLKEKPMAKGVAHGKKEKEKGIKEIRQNT